MSLKIIRNDDGSVTITWDTPKAKGGPDLRYFIVVNGGTGFFSRNSNYSIAKQEKSKEYTVSVSELLSLLRIFSFIHSSQGTVKYT